MVMTMQLMNRDLLFCQFGVATWEVVWYIDAGLDCDDHARSQDGVPLDGHCVVSVHAKVVANMVGVKTAHGLNMRQRENQILVAC
jgi:hypothetical protein